MRNNIKNYNIYKTFQQQQEENRQKLIVEDGEGIASNMVLAKR